MLRQKRIDSNWAWKNPASLDNFPQFFPFARDKKINEVFLLLTCSFIVAIHTWFVIFFLLADRLMNANWLCDHNRQLLNADDLALLFNFLD